MIKRIISRAKTHRAGWKLDKRTGESWSYGFDIYLDGKRVRRSGFATRAEAEQAVAFLKREELASQFGRTTRRESVTLRELFVKRLAQIESEQRDRRALANARTVFSRALSIFGEEIAVEDVTTSVLNSYVEARARRVKPQTVDRELTYIASALSHADRYFDVDFQRPRIPRPKKTRARRQRFITQDESDALIRHLSRERETRETIAKYLGRLRMAHIFEFALLTGARRKEILQLRFSDYIEETDTLRIKRWKTDSITEFSPLPARVRELIEIRREIAEGEFIFSKDGTEMNGLYKSLKRACETLGLEYGRDNPDGFTLHDCRHTFTTRLIQAGVDLATTQSFTGHNSKELVMIYSHASKRSRRQAIEAIDDSRERERLREVFERTRKDELSFEEFVSEIERVK